MKTSSSQQVWEETFNIPLMETSQPIVLRYCSRKAGRFSTLGEAELSLDEFIVGVTYSKHLEILSPGNPRPIGILRMQVCLHNYNRSSAAVKPCSLESNRRSHLHRLHSKQKSASASNLLSTCATNVGPLKSGVQIFEARYLGLLQLNVVARPFSVYARRWSPLEYQPGEVAVITNPLTKATELVSPRLPWPPHFLRGVTALEFNPISGPQVCKFDSAVLYINVVSACGLQSIPLAKFLSKCRADEKSYDSIHRGVMAARLISYYQTMAKNVQPISTQVQIQLGKDKYLTTIEKSTFDPVWNQVFTFSINSHSKTLIEVQLIRIQNPNIAGPAAGTEKIGEALIDISRLPMDFTQRIELELNGKRPKPRLLVLATLTGLTKSECPSPYLALPSASLISSGDSFDRQCDKESNSMRPLQRRTSQRNLSNFNESTCSTRLNEEGGGSVYKTPIPGKISLEEIDDQIIEHYGWNMALKNRFDVGYLRVNVIAASGLVTREMSAKCDSYCLLELINMRVQTQTVRKTLNPKWDKVFVFPVTDVHSVLYITVFDDGKGKNEFLGRVAIPLMKVRNHERSWYALKNADLTERSRGSILLEFFFVYNHLKAAWRTLNPIEPCLKHPVRPLKYKKLSSDYKNAMQENVMRLKVIFKPLADVVQYVDLVCSWENPWLTIGVLLGYNTVVWNFQPYMIPLGMIIGILACRKTSKNPQLLDMISSVKSLAGVGASNLGPRLFNNANSQRPVDLGKSASSNSSFDCENDVLINTELLYSLTNEYPSDDELVELTRQNSEPKDPNRGKKKLNAIMEVVGDLPQILDLIASAVEKTLGLFDWQVPWLTWFYLLFLVIFTLILYFVPLRAVLCIIGTNELTRKLLRPSSRYNFFTFNIISRVPSRPEAVS
nr:hypothetical transcript [Hymenolepis microstoma]